MKLQVSLWMNQVLMKTNAKGRSEEMGKDPKLDDSSEFKDKKILS